MIWMTFYNVKSCIGDALNLTITTLGRQGLLEASSNLARQVTPTFLASQAPSTKDCSRLGPQDTPPFLLSTPRPSFSPSPCGVLSLNRARLRQCAFFDIAVGSSHAHAHTAECAPSHVPSRTSMRDFHWRAPLRSWHSGSSSLPSLDLLVPGLTSSGPCELFCQDPLVWFLCDKPESMRVSLPSLGTFACCHGSLFGMSITSAAYGSTHVALLVLVRLAYEEAEARLGGRRQRQRLESVVADGVEARLCELELKSMAALIAPCVSCCSLPGKMRTLSLSSAPNKALGFSSTFSNNLFSRGLVSVRPVEMLPKRSSIVCEATQKKPDSAAKRARQAEKRRLYNKSRKSEIKTRMKKLVSPEDPFNDFPTPHVELVSPEDPFNDFPTPHVEADPFAAYGGRDMRRKVPVFWDGDNQRDDIGKREEATFARGYRARHAWGLDREYGQWEGPFRVDIPKFVSEQVEGLLYDGPPIFDEEPPVTEKNLCGDMGIVENAVVGMDGDDRKIRSGSALGCAQESWYLLLMVVLLALEVLRKKPEAQPEEVLPIEKLIAEAYSCIDKAVKVGTLHRNTGARRKSRLARRKKAVEIKLGWYTPEATASTA
ncbi:30S ribosomal protein S20 [Striga asiatica]|uniref:30S ribosomal protein S20 n=1 Tax=Striga asiatica TaxID=4170 RepID=A0A5A7R840_STRAF|nr:30S ribosomal protein S20 [Striga asiatica]